ncbi:substrate-binding periplasmic protein [Simiduia agarivorans]|uniref:Uncharacterized protein n=1 Tax=Simiduia agarivorans (strain DSM 21679 / JCM 13881 / BCRC 17597 / SA1) TaxID=1117647 RepID=K4KKB9_SIMAS|nr:ABC transporter substrate-binding protein [Simiduia agarivorans]AFU99604.1 hypothetical protein M5M_12220 [Simiduia agarivorans SA1 = DSM 21679]
MGTVRIVCFVFWLVLPATVALAGTDSCRQLVYPKSSDHWRAAYPVELLRSALANSPRCYQIRASEHEAPKARNFLRLRNRLGLDVVWSMTTREREQSHRPIRIPLNKGLMGNRVALVRADQTDLLAGVKNLEQLRQFSAGQMYVWSDTEVLVANQLTVVPGSGYAALFRMLVAGRFDYFPRSVTEVLQELEHQPQLALDPHLIIRYPAAMYFFVHPDDVELAGDIEAGLRRMIAEGDFDDLFQHYFGDLISQLKLPERRVIALKNPLLPEATPLCEKDLWWVDMCPK